MNFIKINWLAVVYLTLSGCVTAQAQQSTVSQPDSVNGPLRVYTIGNSVTDALNHRAFGKLLAAGGYRPVVARQMIPGAPLQWLLDHPNEGFMEKPYGYPAQAFANHSWDAITLQPFDRSLKRDTQDITEYIELARNNPGNAGTRFYVYARWPRMTKGGKSVKYNKDNYGKADPDANKITDYTQVDSWQKNWTAKYTGGWDNTNESADFFESLTQMLREKHGDVTINMIPVGHAMAALDLKMAAGEVPGHTSIYDFYNDGIHLGPAGSYLVGCTFFATLTGRSPLGLPHQDYGVKDEKLARLIQETVWQTILAQPLAGVTQKPLQ